MMKKVYILVLAFCVLLAPECSAEFREVQFGKYYQTSPSELTPITWLVIDEDDTSLLLLTKDCIDSLPFNATRINVTWEDCSLRRWLKYEFMSVAFTPQEQDANSSTVFLLTIDDAEKYMLGTHSANVSRRVTPSAGKPTPTAKGCAHSGQARRAEAGHRLPTSAPTGQSETACITSTKT